MNKTSQGVRNLNGPRLDGLNHNGHRRNLDVPQTDIERQLEYENNKIMKRFSKTGV